MRDATARADEMLRFTGLWATRDTDAATPSVAQNKRLEPEKALAMNPELPALGGDGRPQFM